MPNKERGGLMLTRRNLLSSLGGLPFLGFLKSEESKIPNITIAENMQVITTYDLEQSFGLGQLSTYKNREPIAKTEIIIELNHGGKRARLRILSNRVTWEAI